jgi:Family of unknown function (DUF5367)
MKPADKLLLFFFGVVIWILGTLWYRVRGPIVLETTSVRYWLNFVLVPIASAVVCILLLRVRHISAREWAAAMLLIALPGMFGEALLLSRFSTFMPRLRAETGGRYGALLFASYAVVLTIAEIVTLRAQ